MLGLELAGNVQAWVALGIVAVMFVVTRLLEWKPGAEVVQARAELAASIDEHAERRAAFQGGVIQAEAILRDPRYEAQQDHQVDISLLNAQKAALVDAARRNLVEPDVAAARVNEIDDALLRMSTHDPDQHY